jgi:hypothetical protein
LVTLVLISLFAKALVLLWKEVNRLVNRLEKLLLLAMLVLNRRLREA